MNISLSDLQPLKEASPIEVTEDGISILSNKMQLLKENDPI